MLCAPQVEIKAKEDEIRALRVGDGVGVRGRLAGQQGVRHGGV